MADKPAEFKITLTYNPEAKNLRVDGAIMDRLVAIGMIEMAKDIINKFHENLTKEMVDQANKGIK